MVRIRVTCGGCGISYEDKHGNTRHALKTTEDGPFMCDEGQAERLVRLGVAVYVTATEKGKSDNDKSPRECTETKTGNLSAEELEKWDFNDLRDLAADMGVKPKGRKKADYIDAIVAEDVVIGSGETDDDELPELGAAEPE